MIKDKYKIANLLILCLPFLVLGYLAINAHHKHNSGKLWRVEITGYDPRDLIHGRFLRYQIRWDKYGEISTGTKHTTDSLCLTRSKNNDLTPIITQIKTESDLSVEDCQSILIAGKNKDNWNTRLRQYYIPESFANALDWAFRQPEFTFSIDVRINSSGTLSVADLYINDEIMHKAMDKILMSYGARHNKNVIRAHSWRLKIKDITPSFISEERSCIDYSIDWKSYGVVRDTHNNTPDLCFIQSVKSSQTPIISLIDENTDISNCTSIAKASPWGRDSWNTPSHTVCHNRAQGKYMVAQSHDQDNLFTVQVTLNNGGSFYSPIIFINDQNLLDAIKSIQP